MFIVWNLSYVLSLENQTYEFFTSLSEYLSELDVWRAAFALTPPPLAWLLGFNVFNFSTICLYCLSKMGDGTVKKSVKCLLLILDKFGYFRARRPNTWMQLAIKGACDIVSVRLKLRKNFSEHLVHNFSASWSSSTHKK